MDIIKDITETWHVNNRINTYLLGAIDSAHLADAVSSKGRNVLEQFAHIHNVRLMWLKVAAPDLHKYQTTIGKEDRVSKDDLIKLLEQSAAAIGQLLEKGLAEGKIKGFKPHPNAFMGYLIAHEGHHRGQIALALKQSGHKLDQKVLYGLWEWGSR